MESNSKKILILTKTIAQQIDSTFNTNNSNVVARGSFEIKEGELYLYLRVRQGTSTSNNKVPLNIDLIELGDLYISLSKVLDDMYQNQFGRSIEYYEMRSRSNYEKTSVKLEIYDSNHGNTVEIALKDHGYAKEALNQIMHGDVKQDESHKAK